MAMEALNTVPSIWIPSNALILTLAFSGLCVLAWITAKDVILEEWRFFLLEMRMRRIRQTAPPHEKLKIPTRIIDGTKHIFLGRPNFSAIIPDESEPQHVFRLRIRREIDRIVGREEYHGQKEQL